MSVRALPRSPDNSIGFLRLALATLVLWGHSWYLAGRAAEEPISRWLLSGAESVATFAVKGFFALSGYLVMQSEQRLTSTRRFLWHRLLRIYPGFWACLLVTGILLPAAIWTLRGTESNWPGAFTYVRANWLLFYEQAEIERLFTVAEPFDDMNGSLWTLPFEISCYALLAFFGWLGLLRRNSLPLWSIGAVVTVLYVCDIHESKTPLFFLSEGRKLGAWFLVGVLAANLPQEALRRALIWPVVGAAAISYFLSCRIGGAAYVGPLAISAVVLGLAFNLPLQDFEQRVGGDYSYGIYIYAYPVQQSLILAGVLAYGALSLAVATLLVSSVLAVASWHLVEKHALKWKSLGRVRDLSTNLEASRSTV